MPAYDHTDATVNITIEVDGHILTITEKRPVRGARYHGKPVIGYGPTVCFEYSAREQTAQATSVAMQRAGELMRRMYPLAADADAEAAP